MWCVINKEHVCATTYWCFNSVWVAYLGSDGAAIYSMIPCSHRLLPNFISISYYKHLFSFMGIRLMKLMAKRGGQWRRRCPPVSAGATQKRFRPSSFTAHIMTRRYQLHHQRALFSSSVPVINAIHNTRALKPKQLNEIQPLLINSIIFTPETGHHCSQ